MLFEKFPDAKVIYAFSNRAQGNMSLCYGDTKKSLDNRKGFLQELGIDYRDLICAKQVHGNRVRYVREGDRGKGALSYDTAISGTDGLITDRRRLPLAIFTADCLPVFLYDPKAEAIGLAHAGWRSTKERIAETAFQSMQDEFNTQAKDLCIGFGPAIRSCCYAVEEEFSDFFSDGIIKRDNHYYLDLIQINTKQLLALGVKQENIFDSRICTFCSNKDFFSFRKEAENCGRMMSVLMLR